MSSIKVTHKSSSLSRLVKSTTVDETGKTHFITLQELTNVCLKMFKMKSFKGFLWVGQYHDGDNIMIDSQDEFEMFVSSFQTAQFSMSICPSSFLKIVGSSSSGDSTSSTGSVKGSEEGATVTSESVGAAGAVGGKKKKKKPAKFMAKLLSVEVSPEGPLSVSTEFTVSCHFQNNGVRAWPQPCTWSFMKTKTADGSKIPAVPLDLGASIEPGQETTVTLKLMAPDVPGSYLWRGRLSGSE